jgi:hypothetical protein
MNRQIIAGTAIAALVAAMLGLAFFISTLLTADPSSCSSMAAAASVAATRGARPVSVVIGLAGNTSEVASEAQKFVEHSLAQTEPAERVLATITLVDGDKSYPPPGDGSGCIGQTLLVSGAPSDLASYQSASAAARPDVATTLRDEYAGDVTLIAHAVASRRARSPRARSRRTDRRIRGMAVRGAGGNRISGRRARAVYNRRQRLRDTRRPRVTDRRRRDGDQSTRQTMRLEGPAAGRRQPGSQSHQRRVGTDHRAAACGSGRRHRCALSKRHGPRLPATARAAQLKWPAGLGAQVPSITKEWFDKTAHNARLRNLDRQGKIAESQATVDRRINEIVKTQSDEDGRSLLDRGDADELEARISAYLDTRRAGDAVLGERFADLEDGVLGQLDAEETHHAKNFMSLRSQAIAAQARLSGHARRPTGYDTPVPSGKGTSVGPVILTCGVGLIEWYQTGNWFSSNLSLYQSSVGGTERTAIILAISGLLTAIVMAITFVAGRRLKDGTVARNARKAEGNVTGGGGELGAGLGFAAVAVFFQTVTLAMRFATKTDDPRARAGAIIIGLVSFFGALAVLLWEYSSFRPSPSLARVICTREADAATIKEFRDVEQRMQQGIPRERDKVTVAKYRQQESALERLQPVALELGEQPVRAVTSYLDRIRGEIAHRQNGAHKYEPLDLEAEARAQYPAQE